MNQPAPLAYSSQPVPSGCPSQYPSQPAANPSQRVSSAYQLVPSAPPRKRGQRTEVAGDRARLEHRAVNFCVEVESFSRCRGRGVIDDCGRGTLGAAAGPTSIPAASVGNARSPLPPPVAEKRGLRPEGLVRVGPLRGQVQSNRASRMCLSRKGNLTSFGSGHPEHFFCFLSPRVPLRARAFFSLRRVPRVLRPYQ